jgi:fructose-1,6-bisphosphatase/inositol monophosphatase family enzyme
MNDDIILNGIDGTTGEYLVAPITPAEAVGIAHARQVHVTDELAFRRVNLDDAASVLEVTANELPADQAEVLTRGLPAVRDIRRLGSAAVALCLVADGRVDGYYELGLNPWDLAAGWLVVTEAGGVVHGPGEVAGATLASRPGSGARVEANLTVAANPSVTAALLDLLAH